MPLLLDGLTVSPTSLTWGIFLCATWYLSKPSLALSTISVCHDTNTLIPPGLLQEVNCEVVVADVASSKGQRTIRVALLCILLTNLTVLDNSVVLVAEADHTHGFSGVTLGHNLGTSRRPNVSAESNKHGVGNLVWNGLAVTLRMDSSYLDKDVVDAVDMNIFDTFLDHVVQHPTLSHLHCR